MVLYKKVKDYLLSEIEKMEEGALLPSQSCLMRKFNVCHLTVRRALEDLEKEGLIITKQGKGTFVRKKIKVSSAIKILIVVPQDWKTDFYTGVPFMEKLIDEAVERRLHIHIFPFSGNYYDIMRIVGSQKFHGVIWLMPWEKDLPVLEEISEKGCCVMVINRIFPGWRFSYVSTDHEQGAYNGTRYLIDKGHRKIGFIGYIEASHIIQRYNGFCRAFDELNINVSECRSVNVCIDSPEWKKHLMADFKKMLSTYQPTGIFVSGISILLNGVLPVLRERQLQMPKDLEVITYDELPCDIPEKNVIHEIVQPFYEMGRISIEKMADIIKGVHPFVGIKLEPEILIKEGRESYVMTIDQQKR